MAAVRFLLEASPSGFERSARGFSQAASSPGETQVDFKGVMSPKTPSGGNAKNSESASGKPAVKKAAVKKAAAKKTTKKKAASKKAMPEKEIVPKAPTASKAKATATPKPKPAISKPDAMSAETFEFLAAIDEAKRTLMVSNPSLAQVLDVLRGLGYGLAGKRTKKAQLTELESALAAYKKAHQRLFPNWSEVFTVAREAGFERPE